ncbi:MAG: LysM peptidoglycan-binding domain-containing protein [Clostridium sp.]|nr:LysM peptidoglycan-binding domain-containing protein [Clostridium sp.]
MKKILIICALACASCLPSMAQELSARDTLTDRHIVAPSSFDHATRDLYDNWYLRRYTVLDSVARNARGEEPTDEVLISRLQRLPVVIDMPFNPVVRSYIMMYVNKPKLVERMLGLGLYYMPIFEDALEKYQLPHELKYLPIIESALDPNAISKAGAGGLWQFMPSTATGEGLEINSLIDERRDPLASSDAAARLLLKYYNIFNDWPLAIAAYNCGPGNVTKAIKKAGDKQDFWEIYPFLPEETKGYVPAFIAANYIMNFYADHGISHALARRPIVTDTVHINRRIHFQQISDVLGVPMDELRMLNPQYRAEVIPGNIRSYHLILPSVQSYCYAANEDSIANYMADTYAPAGRNDRNSSVSSDERGSYIEELTVVYHKVKKGETLQSIAKKYGTTTAQLRKDNNLKKNSVKAGKTLKVNVYTKRYLDEGVAAEAQQTAAKPEKASSSQPLSKPAASKAKTSGKKASGTTTYTVRKGDSLDKIARKHGVTVKAIKTANGLKNDKIQAGQKLKIPKK